MKISGRILLLQIAFLAIVTAAFAQAPKTLSYQGTLSDGGGPLTGSHDLTFKIYNASSGGTALWTETNAGVSISSGNVSLTLGKIVPINIQTVAPMWMGITVDGNAEISPRVELSGTLYSLGLALPYQGTSSGSATGIEIIATGSGYSAEFGITNGSNSGVAMSAFTEGTGEAIRGTHIGSTGSVARLIQSAGSNTSPVLLIEKHGAGNAITANRPIQATYFIGDGSLLTNLPSSGGFSLPYSASASDSSALFSVSNTGSGPAIHASSGGSGMALAGVTGSGWAGIYGQHYGEAGHAGKFEIQNANNGWPALEAATSGPGNALKASTSTGWAAISGVNNGGGIGVHGENNGAGNGFAGLFQNTSVTNTFPALQASTLGEAPGVRVYQESTAIGRGMDVFMTNPNGTQEGLYVNTIGLGMAANFGINNVESASSAVQAYSTGSGATIHSANAGSGGAGVFNIDNPLSSAPVIEINQAGSGYGIYSNGSIFANGSIQATSFIGDGSLLTSLPAPSFPIQSASASPSILLDITNSGDAGTAAFTINNTENAEPVLSATTNGNGFAGLFTNTNPDNGYGVLSVNSNGQGASLAATSSGAGVAGTFDITDSGNSSYAVGASTVGLGSAASFVIGNGSNASPVVSIIGAGIGNSITANGTIQANAFVGDGSGLTGLPALSLPYQVNSGEAGTLLGITASGTAVAGSFVIDNASGDQPALIASTNGVGFAASISNVNSENNTPALDVTSYGLGAAVGAIAYGAGPAGRFDIYSAESSSYALAATTGGSDGGAAYFNSGNENNNAPAMYVSTSGNGNAAFFGSTKVDATKAAVLVTTNAVNYPAGEFTHDASSGTAGNAGRFRISSTTSSSAAIDVNTQGLAAAGEFFIQNSANDSWAIGAVTSGTGPAALFNATNSGSTSPVLRIMGSGTGNSITADGTIQANAFVGDGSGLTNLPAGSFALPITATSSNASPLFNITSTGDGVAGLFSITNTTNNTSALAASTNGTGVAVSFYNSNPDNYNAVLDSRTNGVGPAAFFDVQNPAANTPAMSVSTNSTNSPAGSFENWGSGGSGGHAGQFGLHSPNNGSSTLLSYTLGIGAAAEFTNLNGANTSPVVVINGAGTGNSITASGTIEANAFVGDGSGLTNLPAGSFALPITATSSDASPLVNITSSGDGIAGLFSINNTANNTSALAASTNGTGVAVSFYNSNPDNYNPVLDSRTNGIGPAAFFNVENTGALYPAMSVTTNASSNPAVSFENTGSGGAGAQAGTFRLSSPSSVASVVGTYQSGLGPSGEFNIQNVENDSWALAAVTNGTGPAFIANAGGGGAAIKIINGGLQYNVNYVNSSSIDVRSAVYIIASGGSAFSFSYSPNDGETCIVLNATGSTITVGGVSIDNDETRQLIYLGGWRGL